jgi:hypothetical protein
LLEVVEVFSMHQVGSHESSGLEQGLFFLRHLVQHSQPGGRQGWPAILSSLKSVLETGNPLPIQMAQPLQMLEALKEMGIKTP